MDNIDAILAKVQKLLNVEGRTPKEAALYVERAHAILAEHDLSISDVADLKADTRTAVRKGDNVHVGTEGKPDGWKSDVLQAVARAFECRVLFVREWEETKSGRMRAVNHGKLVGFGHDVEAAGYAQSFLVNEIIRLSKEYSRGMWDDIRELAQVRGISVHDAESRYVLVHGTHPLKAELYFVKGAAQTVSEALTQEARSRRHEAAQANPNALVIQKSKVVDDFLFEETYGMTREEARAKRAESQARWDRERAAEAAQVKEKAKEETPSARRRREEAEERRRAKDNQRYWNQYAKEQAKTDHSALRAGQAAGRTLNIRPGVRPGTTEGERIG